MSRKANSKALEVYCNHCRQYTVHQLMGAVVKKVKDEDEDEGWMTTCTITFEMLQCAGCQEVVLRRTFRHFKDLDNPGVQFFPPATSRQLPVWLYRLSEPLRLLLEEILQVAGLREFTVAYDGCANTG